MEYKGVDVKITKSRWNVYIDIVDQDNKEHTFIASADSGLTWGDNIWFGTVEEYEEDLYI